MANKGSGTLSAFFDNRLAPMTTDALGDRMKDYERRETGAKFLPMLPIYARIDGRGFSRFTSGFERPFDPRFRALMQDTTAWLVQATGARIGYTQSDEISLCWLAETYEAETFFGGKKQKMVSQLAALATQRFNKLLWISDDPFLRQAADKDPTFDARVFQLPNQAECANAFLWREWDATKNALSMACRELYSHKELEGRNGSEQNELLFRKGVNFNDYPAIYKRGVYLQRRKVRKPLDAEVLARIPEGSRPEDGCFERSVIQPLDMPPLAKVINRTEVIFAGANPQVQEELE